VVKSHAFGRWAAVASAVLALGLVPATARADDPPATFVAIGPLYYSSSSYVDKSGKQHASSCDFQKDGYTIYVQQRIDAADSARLSTEYDNDSCGGSSTRGLYDIELDYLKGVSGSAHPTQFQLEGSLFIPPGYSIAANPRLGFGRPGAQLGGVYNGTFKAGALYGYIIASVAARGYTGYPAPQLQSNVTAGINLSKRVLVYESYYGTTHLGAGGTLLNIGLNPTVNAEYDSYTLSENLAYALSRGTSLALTYQSQLGAWNSGIGTTLQAGVWLRF
jgi:hypothetical protein